MNLISMSCGGNAKRGVTRIELATSGFSDPYASFLTCPATANAESMSETYTDFLYHVVQRGAILPEEFLCVRIRLPHLNFHVGVIAYEALVVLRGLANEVSFIIVAQLT